MPSDPEARVLRLENDLVRLEGRLAAAEARAAQLEQFRRQPRTATGTTPLPTGNCPIVVNFDIGLAGVAVGSWAGSTVTVQNAASVTIWTGTTDNWGYVSGWVNVDPTTEVGLTYTVLLAHPGRAGILLHPVIAASFTNASGSGGMSYAYVL